MSRESSNVFSASFHFNCSVLKGNLRPEEALQSLTIYEGNFSRLKDEREKCARAKEALELTDTGVFSGSEERVQVSCHCSILKVLVNNINDKYHRNTVVTLFQQILMPHFFVRWH